MSSTRRQRHRILIVDDDVDVIEPFKEYFSRQGYAVETADSLSTASRAAQKILPSLVLAGTQLPDAPGIELLKWLRARPRTAHVPVMFIASVEEAGIQHDILAAGADDFIVKPFDVDIVGLRVRNAIARTERDGLTEPRTRLPTGRLLQEQVQRLARMDGWAKLEISINDFVAFRERYDFIAADDVLVFTANLLVEVSQEMGDENDFIGHRDGENFVLITNREAGPQVAEQAILRFNKEVRKFYSFVDRERGYIVVESTKGSTLAAPLMTLNVKVQQAAKE
ncbi:MAG: response regulator [Anaerolineae bacterium]|nr:response regulator [Anaerolineae bacterium]